MGNYWYFSRTGWKILEHSTHHFDNGLIIWGWSMRNVGLTKVSSRNSPTSWGNINTSQANKIYEDYILSSLVLNTHYVMFPRHETALIHYTGRAVINLGLDFTSRDLVDSYRPKGYATCPVRLFFQWHDVLAFSQLLHVWNKIKCFSCLFGERERLTLFAETTGHKKLLFPKIASTATMWCE